MSRRQRDEDLQDEQPQDEQPQDEQPQDEQSQDEQSQDDQEEQSYGEEASASEEPQEEGAAQHEEEEYSSTEQASEEQDQEVGDEEQQAFEGEAPEEELSASATEEEQGQYASEEGGEESSNAPEEEEQDSFASDDGEQEHSSEDMAAQEQPADEQPPEEQADEGHVSSDETPVEDSPDSVLAGPDGAEELPEVQLTASRGAPAPLPVPALELATPATAVLGGRMLVAVRGGDGAVWQRWYEKGWSKSRWESLGGKLTSAPALAADHTGRLWLFGRGTDGTLFFRTFEQNRWSNWTSTHNPADTSPAAAVDPDGTVVIAVRGSQGAVFCHWHREQRWQPWVRIPAQAATAPALAFDAAGTLWLFVRWADGTLRYRRCERGQWSGWESLGGQLTSAPAATSDGENGLWVGGRGTEGGVHFRWLTRGQWSDWTSFKGKLASGPALGLNPTRTLTVFGCDTGGALVETQRARGWSPWSSLGVPSAAPAPQPAPAPSSAPAPAPRPVASAPAPRPATLPSVPLPPLPLAPPGSESKGQVQHFASHDDSPPWFSHLLPQQEGMGGLGDVLAATGTFTGPVASAPALVQALRMLPVSAPGDVMRQYTHYMVPALEAGDQPIVLHSLQTQYLVSGSAKNAQDALKASAQLQKAMAPETAASAAKQYGLRPGFLQDVYLGKGAPEEMLITLALVYRHRAKMGTYWSGATDAEALENHYRSCMGLDCNGFVSIYYGKRYCPPASKRAGRPIDYLPLSTNKFRASISDIQPDDALVFGKASHIAVVESVDAENNTLVVVESQSDSRGYDGLIRSTYRVDGVTASAEPLDPDRKDHSSLQRFLTDNNAYYKGKRAAVEKDSKLDEDAKQVKYAELEADRAAVEQRYRGYMAKTFAHSFSMRPELFSSTGLPYSPTKFMATPHLVWVVPSAAVIGGWY